MEKKYKTEKVGNALRIIALKDFSDVKKGDKGGLIEKEENLSQEGNCWVYGEAWIYGNAVISDNAKIYEKASVGGIARVFGCACVYGDATVCGNAQVYGNAKIFGIAQVYGDSRVYGDAQAYGRTHICRTAEILGNVKLHHTNVAHYITTPIKDNKDYITLVIDRAFYVFTGSDPKVTISSVEENYIQNIKIIRQLYGEEI